MGAGDLFYLEVQFSDNNDKVMYVTASTAGFFVNQTTNNKVFNPLPHANYNTQYTLVDLLCQVCRSLL